MNIPRGTLHNFHNGTDETLRMVLTFTPSGIEHFFQECLERAHDLTQECPDNLAEVGPRFMEAGPRYGITFFPDAQAPQVCSRIAAAIASQSAR